MTENMDNAANESQESLAFQEQEITQAGEIPQQEIPQELSQERKTSPERDVVALREAVFRRTPSRRHCLQQILRLLEPGERQDILDFVSDDALSSALHAAAPDSVQWSSAAEDENRRDLLHAAGQSRVLEINSPNWDHPAASFDAAVVSNLLEFVVRPEDWMSQVHKVLRPKARLVLHVRRRKHSFTGMLRRWAGLNDPSRLPVRQGFSPAELFDVIKDGFDVQETVVFGRFFSEFAELLADLFAGMVPSSCETAARQSGRLKKANVVFAIFTPIFALASVLDAIFFFLPAHHMLVRAKRRRLWAPRITPRLRDGRSIAEAALGSRIGLDIG